MNLKITTLTLLASTLMLANHSVADDIYLGEPAYGGSGCPQGSASATLSPDRKYLSILFDEYITEAGYSTGKKVGRKSCNLAIPVHVPQGFSVSIFAVDYRGYAYVPRGGRATFSTEYFFAGQRGPRFRKNFRGGFDDEFDVDNEVAAGALVWSRCGQDVNLRINSSMLAVSNRNYDDVFTTIDSADVSAGLIYHFQWKRCR